MSSVFISSRIRELEAEREMARETLEKLGFKVIMWEDLPAKPSYPREVFLKEVENSQLLVLILWKEFSAEVAEEVERAMKVGIPVLAFVKKVNSGWNENCDPQLQAFIGNISNLAISWKQFRKLSELRLHLKEAIMAELCEHLKKPFLSHSSQDLYELAEYIAGSAKKRVFLLARSLILVTGPRPYLSDSPIRYEKSFHDCLKAILKKSKEGIIKFCCSYIIPVTLKELSDHSEIREYATNRLKELFDSSSEVVKLSRFSIASPPLQWDPSFTFIVGDDRFAIWFRDPKNPEVYPCIYSQDYEISAALVHIFESVCKKKSLDDLLAELRLDGLGSTLTQEKRDKGLAARAKDKVIGALEK